MTDFSDMPPDPFADDGIEDPFALELAEELAHDGAPKHDPRWDHIDGPSIDEFDAAAHEIDDLRDDELGPDGFDSRAIIVRTVVASVAVIVVLALVVLYLR